MLLCGTMQWDREQLTGAAADRGWSKAANATINRHHRFGRVWKTVVSRVVPIFRRNIDPSWSWHNRVATACSAPCVKHVRLLASVPTEGRGNSCVGGLTVPGQARRPPATTWFGNDGQQKTAVPAPSGNGSVKPPPPAYTPAQYFACNRNPTTASLAPREQRSPTNGENEELLLTPVNFCILCPLSNLVR